MKEKKLYLVTDRYDYSDEKFLFYIEEACKAGVSLVQLREKEISDRDLLSLAIKVKKITDKYSIPLIIDDRLDVAMILQCGLHLGQSDIPVYLARKYLGDKAIIGASAKTLNQGIAAEKEGADYLGIGAIYPTTTKVITKITSTDTLREIISHVNIPCYAIGGLKADNLNVLNSLNIEGICVVSAIMKSNSPYQTTLTILEELKKLK